MEFREGHMLNKVRHRIPRAVRVVCAGTLAFLPLYQAAAAGCDANMAGEPALARATVQVRGQARASRSFVAAEVGMVLARERGVDVALEVTDAAGRLLARGDGPIRRMGVRRVQIAAQSGARYNIEVTGKDRGDSNGSVELQVIDLSRAANSTCVDAQKTLARADAAYAAGQAVTRATVSGPGVSSEKSYQEAAAAYREATAKLQAAGASPLLAQAQLAEASLLNIDIDSFADSKPWAVQAAQTYAALGDDYGNARARAIQAAADIDVAVTVNRSVAANATEQAATMLGLARESLVGICAFHVRRGEFYDAGWVQNEVGLAYYYEGRYDEAIRSYQKSLPYYEQAHARLRQVQVLQNVALVEYELGRISASVPHFRQALGLIKPDDNPKLYAQILGNSALANWAGGNQDVALRQFAQSLALGRTIQSGSVEVLATHNMASVYASLGDEERALELYRQALGLLKISENVRIHMAALRAMANIVRQQGHPGDALGMDREALSLAATPAATSLTRLQIAKDLIALGRFDEAAGNLESVLREGPGGEQLNHAWALQERAKLRAASGDLTAAESDLKTALQTFRTYEQPTDQFDVWLALARIARRRGALGEAFASVDEALALAEEVRLQSANPELRATLLQPLRPAFDLRISLLFEQYTAADRRPAEQAAIALRALETAEQARTRALADYQTLDAGAPGIDPSLLQRRQALYHELATRRFRLEASLDKSEIADPRNQAIRAEIASLRQEVDQIDAKIGAASQSASTRQAPLRESTGLSADRIPEEVAVTEYWLGDSDSFAWVVSRSGVTMTRIGSSARINSEATALHTAMRSFGSVPRSERLAAGERLYGLILGPIESQLAAFRTLIFAPDGALHYVPFAALRQTIGGRKAFLVENHDVAVTPSLQMFLRPAPRQAQGQSRGMLLVDDPVYDPADSRVSRSGPPPGPETQSREPALALVRGPGNGRYLPRLPGAAREAAAIEALMPSGTVDRLDGFAANRESFLASGLDRYRLIHVASHASTDSEIPQASALILSTVNGAGTEIDGRVLAADFMAVRINADTVVLSACDTALGKSVAGEGLVGLQYIVLARGARSVVSSLWPAMDQGTADIMVRFYSSLLNQHSTVISAWSAASRALLNGPYSDPGTWGAFMLTLSHIEDVRPLPKLTTQTTPTTRNKT